jgi:hypothetical protein
VNVKHLIAVEKMTSLLAAVLLLGGLLFLPRHTSFSLAVGAGLMVANAWLMRRVAAKAGPALTTKPGLTLILFNFKLAILAVAIFVALRYLHVAPLPFIVGVSVLPAAILIVALRHQLTPEASDGAHDEETNG